MQIKGKITHWNREKAWGFITPESGAKSVFVHISSIRNPNLPPRIGQLVTFSLSEDRKGRPCAIDVARDGEPSVTTLTRRRKKEAARRGSRTLLSGLVIALVAIAVGYYYRNLPEKSSSSTRFSTPLQSHSKTPPRFQCDGRTYCSEMTSCEEATFFIRNCPNTKMDGDHDGIPCESQWCVYH